MHLTFLVASNKKGFFYSDEYFGKNITGVLFRTYYGACFYYHNEKAINKLNPKNFNFFSELFYK